MPLRIRKGVGKEGTPLEDSSTFRYSIEGIPVFIPVAFR